VAAPSVDRSLAPFFHPTDPQALYLVDPNGNWLMTYAAGADSPGILADIKRLLSLSNIG
jgi:hypothetical protein